MNRAIPIVVVILIIAAVATFAYGLYNQPTVNLSTNSTLNNTTINTTITTNNNTVKTNNSTTSQVTLAIQKLAFNPSK